MESRDKMMLYKKNGQKLITSAESPSMDLGDDDWNI